MADQSAGRRIRLRRQALGLTQQQLADRVGVDRNTVSAWERDKHLPQRNEGALEVVLGMTLGPVNGTPLPPADPRERELYDLALVDAGPEGAWAVVEEFRRRKRSRIA